MKQINKSNGITLVALIITIIVMLILVGVVISLVTGNKGVITQAEKANAKMEQENIKETIQTSYYYDEKKPGKLDYIKTKDSIEKKLISAGYVVNIEDGSFPITIKVTGETGTYDFLIQENEVVKNEDKLIYGKIYKGMIPDNTSGTMIETEVIFTKKYNKIIKDNEEINDFTYNKQESKVSAF